MARAARKTGIELGLHIAGLAWGHPATARLRGGIIAAAGLALIVALATYNAADPSLNVARDYWVALSAHAGVLWVFQTRLAGDQGAWFLHGVFA